MTSQCTHARSDHHSSGAPAAPPFIFNYLQIPLSANPLFSHPSETPGCHPLGPISEHSVLRSCPACRVFSVTYRLFFSLGPFFAHAGLCFQRLAASFVETGGWGGQREQWSPRTRAQWRTCCERPRTHAEARAERWRHVAKRIAAARAAALVAECAGGIRAEPVASRFALRIDALHGEPGQKLHIVSPQRAARSRRCSSGADPIPLTTDGLPTDAPLGDACWRGFWPRPRPLSRTNTTICWG